jgi:hypothetical protein
MEARTWTVESESYSGLYAKVDSLGADYDVIWLVPGADRQMLCQASAELFSDFVQNGGTLVALGVSGESTGLDLMPGGVDVIPELSPGSTVIHDPTHPLIDATADGGAQLTAADLDPQGTGGLACVGPDTEGVTCDCLARNDLGPVLTTYGMGSGHVVMSMFDMLDEPCMGNLLIYSESLVAGL